MGVWDWRYRGNIVIWGCGTGGIEGTLLYGGVGLEV